MNSLLDLVTLALNYEQMGVGGDTSWDACTHSEDTLAARDFRYRFRLRPLSSKRTPRLIESIEWIELSE
jgi:hypothetical protein